jgi:hypothetical protein
MSMATMIELNEGARKFLGQMSETFVGLGYLLIAVGEILHGGYSNRGFFQAAWPGKVGLILIAAGFILAVLTNRKPQTSIRFWIIAAGCLAGMFYFGSAFLGFLFLLGLLVFLIYKTFEATGGFLANLVKSYRQIRNEAQKD